MKKKAKAAVFGIVWIIFSFAACKKVKIESGVPLQEVLIEYPMDNVQAFTARNDGMVFLITIEQPIDEFMSGYKFYQYNIEGKCVDEYELGKYSYIQAIAAQENKDIVYFIGQEDSNALCLFAFHLTTRQIDKLCEFPYFKEIKKMICTDSRIYVLGQRQRVEIVKQGTSEYDFSAEEKLIYYSIDDQELYDLGFEFPINMALGEGETIVVLGYLAENGYCLMEYDPVSDTMKIKKRLDAYKFDDFVVCNEGKSLIYGYVNNPHGLVKADYNNMELEVELYEYVDQNGINEFVWYAGERVYCMDSISKHLISFPLDAVQRQNKELRLISELPSASPYGCGYVIDWVNMSWDKIVLKTLAQDRDYDLCMGSSSYAGSYAMKNSDSFYPLNDVPGIEEYMERCFPYVREAATKESGAIWMLPFTVWTSGVVVQEDQLEQTGISLWDNMTYMEFAELIRGLSEEEKNLIDLSSYYLSNSFAQQYFWHNTSVKENSFFTCMESLRELYEIFPPKLALWERVPCMSETFGMDIFDDITFTLSRYEGSQARVYSFPRGKSTDKNMLGCYFLAVNPNSTRLKETLSYLADLIAYLMERDDIWYFKDFQTEPSSFAEQVYGLYQDGEIPFAIDKDVYETGFEEALNGELPLEKYIEDTDRKLQMYLGE